PGKGWEWIVYNNNDQPILTQDAVQRGKASKEWRYTKYDAFGRVTSTGIYTNTATNSYTTQEQMANFVNTHTGPLWEERNGATTYPTTTFPTAGVGIVIKPHLVNYYDDYTFTGASSLAIQGHTRNDNVKTLLTGSLVYRADGTQGLLTVNYYDSRARLIQSVSENHLKGTDRITNEYTFTGELTKSTRVHSAKSASTTIVHKNEYDQVGRLLTSKHKIGNQDTVVLASNAYNEIGQLRKKSIGGDKDGANFHTLVDYAYNERSWLDKASSAHFSYDLDYNVNNANATLTGAQYNGNIAQQLWGHGATTNSTFVYQYDALNRLRNASSSGASIMVEAFNYDDMGNITSLARNNGVTTATTSTSYTYNNGNKSNRLASLSGAITGSYTYDVNGNATKDRTGMTIGYNHLNLPDTVYNSGGSVRIGYLYDGLGTKLRKYSTQGGIRDYVGGIEYGATAIELIHTGEGVAYRNSNGSYTYRYNLTDHLGNVRSTVYRNPTNNAVEVLQRDDYYAFGKQKVVAGGNNKYLYNGKEKQYDFGGHYDYGARFYDA
ncbi:RHS repeat-associated core domain-containing protein, partial [Sphingobacterium faecium]